MAKFKPEDDHALSYIDAVTRSFEITLNEDGQPQMTETAIQCGDILDVTDSWLACTICGILGYDELEDHGINPDWQAP